MKQIILLITSWFTFGHLTINAQQIKYKEQQVRLSTGITLEYVEQGDPGGTPVILLHGITDSWKSFVTILPHLPASLRVFAISQRGHGNSSKQQVGYLPEDFASDIAAFIREKKIAPAIIVGHSMGSTNAQCFAARYPQLTSALVLVGSFANYNKPITNEFGKLIDGLSDPIDSTLIAEFQKSTLTRPISDEMLLTYIDESRKVPAHVWKGVAAAWKSDGYLDALKSYDKPALIIWGDKDTYIPKEDQSLLKNALRHSRLLVYEGTGHACHWEEPRRFAEDLVKFARGVTNNK